MPTQSKGIIPDLPRQVIPRWRLFEDALGKGQLFVPPSSSGTEVTSELSEQLATWKRCPSVAVAADLVSNAFTLGMDDLATDAAEYILQNARDWPLAKKVAALYLNIPLRTDTHVALTETSDIRSSVILSPLDRIHISQICSIRHKLNFYPRSALLWSNLAFHYASLGNSERATRAMRIAVELASTNRFVLRAASRLFLHVGDTSRSHDVLRRSPLVSTDPLIMSAEIAVADALDTTSKNIKQAKRVLESRRHAPRQLSELASAVGTVELKTGNPKLGKKQILLSLQDPTENSIAQAQWVSRQFPAVNVLIEGNSPEAQAWQAAEVGDWGTSLIQTDEWQLDQPFSSRPAIHGSFIASTAFDKFQDGMRWAKIGLRSDPDDPILLNNFAFAAVQIGELNVAEECLKKLAKNNHSNATNIALYATSGLLAYRRGIPELGRGLYKTAISIAQSKAEWGREALATTYFAIEELRCNSKNAEEACTAAIAASDRLATPLGRLLSAKIKQEKAQRQKHEVTK